MEHPSRLLRLPRELRDKVLFYACEGRIFKVVDEDIKLSRGPPGPRPGLRFDRNLLLINHQFCEEVKAATIAAYTTNVFHLESPLVLKKFASMSCSRDLRAIRQIKVDLTTLRDDVVMFRRWFDVLSDVLADQFVGLEDLHAYKKPAVFYLEHNSTTQRPRPVDFTEPSPATRLRKYRASICAEMTRLDSWPDESRMYDLYCRMTRVQKPESMLLTSRRSSIPDSAYGHRDQV